ncbi:MAG: DUF2231 domain-containing protein [Myxococcota bacterium]
MKLFGHPAHAISVHLPIGLLGAVPLCDLVAVFGGGSPWWTIAYGCLLLGNLTAVVAVATGLADYAALTEHTARVANRHLGWMLAAVALYLTSLLWRGGPAVPSGAAHIGAPVISALGAILLAVGGWYGGHLVYDHGVGVRPPGGEADRERPPSE